MFNIDWIGLSVPFAYIVVLAGSLITFSSIYRKRKAAKSASLAPWFPPHLQRNIYLSLLHMEPEEGNEKAPKVPDITIKAALLRRAVEDIRRIIQIRNAKPAINSLLQRGSVGDDLWQRFLRAEAEMEEELKDVVMEANALSADWGKTIFQTANEIAANEVFRKRLDEIQAQVTTEKAWWDKRREAMKNELLETTTPDTGVRTKTPGSDEDTIVVESGGPAANAGGKKKKAKK